MIFAAWKSGSRYSADAQKVAEEIYSIGESATTAQILDKARDEKSELHKCFEWDDTKAVESWRMQQARHLVCNLVIKEETKTAHAPEVRLFFKTDANEGYKPTVLIMQDKGEYQKLLQNALAELDAFQRKYRSLSELENVFDAIEALAGLPQKKPNIRTKRHNTLQ